MVNILSGILCKQEAVLVYHTTPLLEDLEWEWCLRLVGYQDRYVLGDGGGGKEGTRGRLKSIRSGLSRRC